jgi:hypothetical protein
MMGILSAQQEYMRGRPPIRQRFNALTNGAVAASLWLVVLPVQAADTERFSIAKTAEGYVRVNAVSGETSLCVEVSGQLICRLAADDRAAYLSEIDEANQRLADLEKRVAILEGRASSGLPGTALAPQSEEEFSTSLDRMEQFFRRFMGIVKEFNTLDEPAAPAPDRT